MAKDYYFLFSPDNMPLGVFLTETPAEALDLFRILYRRSFDDMLKLGVYMKKEQDVSIAMWEEIHKKYKQRKKVQPTKIIPKVDLVEFKNKAFELNKAKYIYEQGSTQLETEKYLRGKW